MPIKKKSIKKIPSKVVQELSKRNSGSSGMGYTATATNRTTGKTTTTTGTLKRVTAQEYNGAGRYKKASTPRSTTTGYKDQRQEQFAARKQKKMY